MDDKPSIHSLKDDARYMALDHKPASENARQFCHLIAAALAQADAERKYRRGEAKQRQFEDAIGAIVADLLLASEDSGNGWAYRSSRASSFTGDYIPYRTYQDIMSPAKEHGLIDEVTGYHERFPFGKGGAWVSSPNSMTNRYRVTNALLELARGFGITPDTIGHHFLQCLPKHPLELRTASLWTDDGKVKGERMAVEKTPTTEKFEADLHELNRFLDKVVIAGGVHRGYRRIFNEGDQPGFAWNKGGRLYANGRPPYQLLPPDERVKMTFNGEPVAEVDVRASFLTLLYGLKGIPFDTNNDPYEIKHIPRAAVKTWVTMTIGLHGFHKDWPPEAVERLTENAIDVSRLPMPEVRPLFLHHIPVLKDWPDQELTCFDLMYLESEAMLATMLFLMREKAIPALTVHDSLIVPRSAVPLAQQQLKENYKRVCGIEPGLKVQVDQESSQEGRA